MTLKVIREKYLGDESARLRFLREARAAASLSISDLKTRWICGLVGAAAVQRGKAAVRVRWDSSPAKAALRQVASQ